MLRLLARVNAVIRLREEMEARVRQVRVVLVWRAERVREAVVALGRRARVGRVIVLRV